MNTPVSHFFTGTCSLFLTSPTSGLARARSRSRRLARARWGWAAPSSRWPTTAARPGGIRRVWPPGRSSIWRSPGPSARSDGQLPAARTGSGRSRSPPRRSASAITAYDHRHTAIDPTAQADAGREDRGAGVAVRSLSVSQFGVTVLHTMTDRRARRRDREIRAGDGRVRGGARSEASLFGIVRPARRGRRPVGRRRRRDRGFRPGRAGGRRGRAARRSRLATSASREFGGIAVAAAGSGWRGLRRRRRPA